MTGTLHWRQEKHRAESKAFGEMIAFGPRKDSGTGYMSHSSRVGPGVLLLHEFFGLTQAFRDYADALNDEGFTVLAPDLYDGRIASSVEEAQDLARSLDQDRVVARLTFAAEHLTANWHPRLGLVGFSLGAGYAGVMAQNLEVDATVLYYGITDITASRWHGAVLGHFAEIDEWEPLPVVQAAFEELTQHGIEAELVVYPGVGHWFANPDVPSAYDPVAAEDAWQASAEFLAYNLA